MNATMTCNTVSLNPVHVNAHSFLSALRRFFSALLKSNAERPYDLPANMAARLYL